MAQGLTVMFWPIQFAIASIVVSVVTNAVDFTASRQVQAVHPASGCLNHSGAWWELILTGAGLLVLSPIFVDTACTTVDCVVKGACMYTRDMFSTDPCCCWVAYVTCVTFGAGNVGNVNSLSSVPISKFIEELSPSWLRQTLGSQLHRIPCTTRSVRYLDVID